MINKIKNIFTLGRVLTAFALIPMILQIALAIYLYSNGVGFSLRGLDF